MATAPLSNLTATWNASGTTFTAVKMNVTDTASAAGSLLIDLQVGGSSKFSVGKGAGAFFENNLVEFRNTTNAQALRVYNTYTDASNYERGKIQWDSNVLKIGTEKAGTGSARALEFQTDGTTRLTIGTSGAITTSSTITVPNNVSIRVTDSEATARNAIKITTGDTIEYGTTNNNATLNGFTVALITAAGTVFYADNDGLITVRDASNFALGTTTGTKIGTATNQKLGFFNATPVVQPTAVADATDAATVITQLNALLTRMRNLGLIAT